LSARSYQYVLVVAALLGGARGTVHADARAMFRLGVEPLGLDPSEDTPFVGEHVNDAVTAYNAIYYKALTDELIPKDRATIFNMVDESLLCDIIRDGCTRCMIDCYRDPSILQFVAINASDAYQHLKKGQLRAAAGKIFVGEESLARIAIVDGQTGAVVWRAKTSDDGPSAAVVENGYVAFNTESCTVVVCQAKTGKVVWQEWLGDPLMSQPATLTRESRRSRFFRKRYS